MLVESRHRIVGRFNLVAKGEDEFVPLRDCTLCLSCGGYAGILVILYRLPVHLAITEVGESLSVECLFNFCHFE